MPVRGTAATTRQSTQRRDALAGATLLQGVPADVTARVASTCTWREFRQGQEVFGQDSANRDVFFVVDGRVRVTFIAPSGREISFRDLGPGATFGELSAIDGLPRSASVVALADSVLASVSRDQFRDLLRASPVVAERVMLNLAALVRSLTDRVVEFSTLAVQNRIQAELVRVAREAGVVDNRATIAPAPKHTDVANRVATNREAVAREFSRLAREGVVERRRGMLAVLDVRRLAEMVEKVRDS